MEKAEVAYSPLREDTKAFIKDTSRQTGISEWQTIQTIIDIFIAERNSKKATKTSSR